MKPQFNKHIFPICIGHRPVEMTLIANSGENCGFSYHVKEIRQIFFSLYDFPEDEEAQRVKHILHLSETEVMNITHFQRGNGLISTNNNNITVEFKASALEKELITTDRQELLEILARQKQKAG